MRDALQKYGLRDSIGGIKFAHNGLGHAREGCKFIDHSANIFHLTDNRLGALGKNIRLVVNIAAIFRLQPSADN